MSRRDKTLLIVASIILLAIGLVACGPAQEPEDEAATATARATDGSADDQGNAIEESDQAEVEEEEGEEAAVVEEQPNTPEISTESDFDIYDGLGEDAFEITESGLRYVILEEGDGDVSPEAGQVVSVHYTGWLEDGTTFDSSIERGQPFSFPLGQQAVIAGWDEGIALLQVGDRARLIIPSELAYGEAGGGSVIPPNATLIFDVELVDVAAGPPEAPVTVDPNDYVVTDSGLQYYDMVVGDGLSPVVGQVATMHFTIWLEDGTLLGSTLSSAQPVQALVGSGQLFAGWEEGLQSMQVGGSRQLLIPPELAFGEEGTPDGAIPPNTGLIIEMELLSLFDPEQ